MKNRILPTNKNTVAKLILMGGLMAFFCTSCEKEPTPTQPDPNQPKIARLVFDKNGHHIEFDTIRYYLYQGFDSIYMIPIDPNMFATYPAHPTHNVTLFLQDRIDLSPRVKGRETLNVSDKANISDINQLRQMGFNVNVANTTQY